MGTKTRVKSQEVNYVVIRSHMAGVFIGELVESSNEHRWVRLKNSIRLWSWQGASLSQVAAEGHSDSSKNTCLTIDDHVIFDVVEVISATEKAYNTINALPRWRK